MKVINHVLYKEIRTNLWSLLFVLFLMLLLVSFDAIAPWPFEMLIDHVLVPTPITPTTKLAALLSRFSTRELLGFFVVFIYFINTFSSSIVEYLRSSATMRLTKKITADFSKNAFKNLQSLAIGFYNKQQIGDYIYRLSYDVSALGELLEEGVLPLLTSGLLLLVTTTVMFLIDVRLTLFALIALPFLTVGLHSFNAHISRATGRSESSNSAAFSFIEEALAHLKIIQAFSQEHRESRAFGEKIDTSLRAEVVSYRLDFLLTLLVGVIIAISYSLIIVYGIRSVFTGTLSTGLLIVFIFYLDNLTKPILSVIYAAAALKQSYIKVMRMEDFFTAKTHLEYRGKVAMVTDTTIKFDHVTLQGEKGRKILDNVSFEIEPHKRTLVFGVSGSGKTSVINLILRFIDEPTSGNIFIGGVNVKDYNLRVLRDAIAFVPQEITLFNESIRANISFGNPRSSWKDIVEAARLAVADGFIKKLPGGYNFKVGEMGNMLSGGQRQRLMLARAFMKKDAKILLFDETLSALDIKTREEVMENIFHFSKSKTAVIISNVFASLSASDNAVVLNKGRIVFSGPSSRLPKELSLYKMMVESD